MIKEFMRWISASTRGTGLVEYIGVVAVLSAAAVGTTLVLSDTVNETFFETAQLIEEPILVETGFVSNFAEEKVMGIAKDYEGEVIFMNEEAGYKSALGMYRFRSDGTISDIRILFENASKVGSGGSLVPGESYVPVSLKVGDQIGFFLAPNAYSRNDEAYLTKGEYVLLDQDGVPATIYSSHGLTLYNHNPENDTYRAIRTQFQNELFYSHANPDLEYAPNFDNFPHTVGFVHKSDGIITLGFEDLVNGGDMDYDDVVFEFDVGESNAAVLDPNLDYDYDGYDGWVERLRLSETSRYDPR
jgi:hypothetical protein